MSYIVIDVEADGPAPGLFSMVSFGAVIVKEGLENSFYAELKPVSDNWQPESLAISGFTREQTLSFADPIIAMTNFRTWLQKHNRDGRPTFIADNNGFDWQFMNWYFWKYIGENPFRYSSMNLNSLYKGLTKNMRAHYSELAITEHTHHPVDDAMGCAEALMVMNRKFDLNIRFR